MAISSLLIKAAIGLTSLSALSAGAGALYASSVTSESKLTLEEKIAENREKLKKIIDALEERLGEKFKWNEDRWNTVVEKMKKLVPERLHLKMVDYLWLPFLDIFGGPDFPSNASFFYRLMNGSWQIGDSNFRRWLEGRTLLIDYNRSSDGFSELSLPEFYFSDELYLEVKKLFNSFRNFYLERGVDIPEWSDSVWDFSIFCLSLFYKHKSDLEISVSAVASEYGQIFLNVFTFRFDSNSFRSRCLGADFVDVCIEWLKKDYRDLSGPEFVSKLNKGEIPSPTLNNPLREEFCKLKDFKIKDGKIVESPLCEESVPAWAK